ncbi:LIC_13387 family protein [Minwuia thermotolerans]|uniref:Uncharacterized protein n=1 Tax=Minwuia thermotolerans TaxID=2056226 RepID=A0A2M9G2Z0_9PROT|nr:hypothetical protein [Minwuia thermotolerans]PJK30081.1 hypothetical protein CVT23_10000 [Minwuia thermotolerans]
MDILFFLAAGIYAALGGLHLLYALNDIVRGPKYFRPRDRALLEGMQQTTTAIVPKGHDFWRNILGFHLSHSLGAMLFALLIVLAAGDATPWLEYPALAVSALYTLIAWRFWFSVPLIGCALATVLLAAALAF